MMMVFAHFLAPFRDTTKTDNLMASELLSRAGVPIIRVLAAGSHRDLSDRHWPPPAGVLYLSKDMPGSVAQVSPTRISL